MDISTLALVSTAAVAAGAYLNAKYSFGIDIQQLRDDRAWGHRMLRMRARLGEYCTLYRMLELVEPQVEMLWFEGRTWSYGELRGDIDRFAHILSEKGVGNNDFVAVFTTNSPEMIIAVLALSRLGAVSAMINTNLRDDTLHHCLNVSTASLLVSTPDLAPFVPDTIDHLTLSLTSFPNTPSSPSCTLIESSTLQKTSPLTSPPAKRALSDPALLIYTSGTTGKPKACRILNQLVLVTAVPASLDASSPKKYYPLRTYSCLPLFHGTAFFTGICHSLGAGSTLCLARKFSSSGFFKDVAASRATRILYVGELCRYLLNSPATEWDTKHNCIVAAGNGLRGDIWERFKTRFQIPEIREFYRSTEGLAKFDNINSGVWGAGKIGFQGLIRRRLERDTLLLRTDIESGEIYRHPITGFCEKARLGEPGEAVGRVKDRELLSIYLGNEAATEEKILCDVFAKGDVWQRMGDLLLMDKDGWVVFLDRKGDTFRWKGENVSAGEVREHVAKLDGVRDALVWGVALHKYDGKAGAAAITLQDVDEEMFMWKLYGRLRKTGLPSYAIPRLVRITEEISTGATFKQAKGDLEKRSWDVREQRTDQDSLFWLKGDRFVRLDKEGWGEIAGGKAKL
ncbi:hypothetical protein B7494_g7630 [Chlorociboria aeruginascens]|nr:hypothetical protein B7494_g7630 [Chlorociboria aeruginascens]